MQAEDCHMKLLTSESAWDRRLVRRVKVGLGGVRPLVRVGQWVRIWSLTESQRFERKKGVGWGVGVVDRVQGQAGREARWYGWM